MTLRAEFEAHFVRKVRSARIRKMLLTRSGKVYADSQIEGQWRFWKAAYAAGQRAEREACVAVCEAQAQHSLDVAQQYPERRNVLHRRIAASGAYGCADAIRNRKEQG